MKCFEVLLLMCGCSLSAATIKLEILPLGRIIPVKVNVDVNLTCIATTDDGEDTNKTYDISWTLPMKQKDVINRISFEKTRNKLVVSILKFQRSDMGHYICEANDGDVHQQQKISLFVNSSRERCSSQFFDCGKSVCISLYYFCDGYRDCPDGSDESEESCGSDPCEGKIFCDGRCISKKYCCDHRMDPNCTNHFIVPCCHRFLNDIMPVDILEMNPADTPVTYKYHNLGFYQSTIYTMISCAIAFIFMSTIMLIAVCRIRIRRNAWFLQSSRQLQRSRSWHLPMPDRPVGNQNVESCPVAMERSYPGRPQLVDPLENFVLLAYDNNTGFEVAEYGPKPPPYAETSIGIPPPPYSSTIDVSADSSSPEVRNDASANPSTVQTAAEESSPENGRP